MLEKKKLLLIYGPTAAGKTSLALKLAADFKGEIVSADSRQVYQGMDIGTGKDLEKGAKFIDRSLFFKRKTHFKIGYYLFDSVKVWLLDVIPPSEYFSAYQWSLLAKAVIKSIYSKKKLPIVVGGSAFYLKTLLDGLDTAGIGPDWLLRQKLGKLSLVELQKRAKKANQKRWNALNGSDKKNPRRLMRLIEVSLKKKRRKKEDDFLDKSDVLGIYLDASLPWLKKRIRQRVKERLEQGLREEIEQLLKKYSWIAPGLNCLAYKEFKPYFEKKKALKEVKKEWFEEEVAYGKRQKLWFKKDERFVKLEREDPDFLDKATIKVKKWYDGKRNEKSGSGNFR